MVIYLIDRFIPFGSDDLSVSNESKQQLLNVGMITSLAYAFYSITSGIVLIYLLRDHFESGVWMAFSLLLRALPFLYVLMTKFLPRILNSKQNTLSFIGLVLGIILAFLTVLF